MHTQAPNGYVRVGSLEQIKAEGRVLVHGRHGPVLVVYEDGCVYALDNRCPHMGFPLDRGTVEDGILTCHWHHARFDVASGCAFDLWADDVPTCPIQVRDGEVWIRPVFENTDPVGHWRRRLEDGLAHNLGLVMAKSIRGLLAARVAPLEILRQVAIFGVQQRDGWGTGMTVLTALGNLLPLLPREETYLALWQGARRVATDCEGEAPRRARAALTSMPQSATLARWYRQWNAVRHREAAERTLLTAVAAKNDPAALADLLFSAETDRFFADTGHSFDFINKAFECLDLIGWEYAAAVLPSVVGPMTEARGAEESTPWRRPVDLIALLEAVFEKLPQWFDAGRGRGPWDHHARLAHALLDDDPVAIVGALEAAVRGGAEPSDLGRALVYAAALRLARFGTANEHADWETAHHAFTYCNAVHRALQRIGNAPDSPAVRAVFHGAMAIYLARYLNVPPARLPGEDGRSLDDLPTDAQALLAELLGNFDRQRQVDAVGRLVSRYLLLEHPIESLITTLAAALMREDAGFHSYQMFEAGVRQAREWGSTAPARHILVAVGRYLAAHSPTERATYQTADIARRLLSGQTLHEMGSKPR